MLNRSCRLLMLVVIASIVVGCGDKKQESPVNDATKPSPAKTDHGTIGVSLLTMTNPFFKVMGDSMETTAKAAGFTVSMTAGEMDPAKQKDQVNDFIVKKVKAIILSPVDSKSIGTSIIEANKAGIPVFTADIGCLDANAKVVSHVATDNYGGGKLAGEALAEAVGETAEVAIITHPEVESVILRASGFKDALKKHPGIKIVAELPGSGSRDASFKTAQDILEKHPNLNGFFAINDPSALGALAAVEKIGKVGKIKIVGFDGMPEAKQAIKDGKLFADIVQYPDKIGSMSIKAVQDYLSGTKVVPKSLIPAGTYKKADADKDSSLK